MAPGMTIKEAPGFYIRPDGTAVLEYEVWCDSPECGLHGTERTIEEARERVEAHRSMHDLLGIMDRAARR